jgi:hypothetical protein
VPNRVALFKRFKGMARAEFGTITFAKTLLAREPQVWLRELRELLPLLSTQEREPAATR